MNNFYKHKAINGMECYLIKKEGFKKSYCGIGTKFGGNNLKYKIDDKIYNLKPGIAHFIEHKLFAQKDGTDAFNTFTKLNSSANAYTSNDKTVYYFTTNDDLKKPLALLLDMYYNPYFTNSNVESEKDIIISELNMNLDDIGYVYNEKILNELYPNDDYSKMILGEESDIKSITKDDLYEAYNIFYSPLNTILYVVADIEPDLLFSFIDSKLKNNSKNEFKAIKLSNVSSVKPNNEIYYFKDDRISQTELIINLRMDDVTNKDPISCELLLGVFEALLNVSSKLYKKLDKKGLLLNDVHFNVNTSAETSFIMLTFTTNEPLKIIKIMKHELKHLSFKKLKEEFIEIYFRHLKAQAISDMDLIYSLGDKALSLALEDINYFDMNELLINLKPKDISKYIESIKNSKVLATISTKN
ncbi:MAG: insulinase family protein [Acholeplasmatales bacterium]|nr:insulinase family protein [Acholeplasmatales bacterium]